MLTAVFDTNVVVSGIISSNGPPARILDGILDGFYRPIISDAIIAEYAEVLSRPKFDFPNRKISQLLEAFCAYGVSAPYHPFPDFLSLPDPDDVIFIESALALNAPIVTGNQRHFPSHLLGHLRVMSPIEFLSQ